MLKPERHASVNQVKCWCGSGAIYRSDRQHYNGQYAWYCERYPECYSYVAAHSDGVPMGKLADAYTHGLRYKIHSYIDPLWKKNYISRDDTYSWLAEITNTPEGQFHVASLDYKEASKVLKILETQKDYDLDLIKEHGGNISV